MSNMSSEEKARQKLMAELLRRGATLLQEPCPSCGGIMLRYGGRDVCLECDKVSSVEELDSKFMQPPPSGGKRWEVVMKVLDDSLGRLAKERDPVKQEKLLELAKLSAELIRELKELEG